MREKSRIFFLSRSVKSRGILCYSQANNGVIIRSRKVREFVCYSRERSGILNIQCKIFSHV